MLASVLPDSVISTIILPFVDPQESGRFLLFLRDDQLHCFDMFKHRWSPETWSLPLLPPSWSITSMVHLEGEVMIIVAPCKRRDVDQDLWTAVLNLELGRWSELRLGPRTVRSGALVTLDGRFWYISHTNAYECVGQQRWVKHPVSTTFLQQEGREERKETDHKRTNPDPDWRRYEEEDTRRTEKDTRTTPEATDVSVFHRWDSAGRRFSRQQAGDEYIQGVQLRRPTLKDQDRDGTWSHEAKRAAALARARLGSTSDHTSSPRMLLDHVQEKQAILVNMDTTSRSLFFCCASRYGEVLIEAYRPSALPPRLNREGKVVCQMKTDSFLAAPFGRRTTGPTLSGAWCVTPGLEPRLALCWI